MNTASLDHVLLRIAGWPSMLLHGDPAAIDRWAWLRRHLRRGPARTLDAGCGGGTMALYAARIGHTSVGIDYNADNVRRAAERAHILGLSARFEQRDLRADLSDLGQFDHVMCCETLEHIVDDRLVLRTLAGALVPGGLLLMTMPYKHYRPLYGDHLTDESEGGHVRWGYTHEEMKTLFDEVGLDLTEAGYVSGVVVQGAINIQRWMGRSIHGMPAWALTLPLRALRVFDEPVTRMLAYPYLSVAVVGRRL